MTATKALANLAVDMQSLALVGHNYRIKKKKKKAKDFINTGVTNIVGLEMIKAQSFLTSGL